MRTVSGITRLHTLAIVQHISSTLKTKYEIILEDIPLWYRI